MAHKKKHTRQELDKRLQGLFERPGLDGKAIQESLSHVAYGYLDILQAQQDSGVLDIEKMDIDQITKALKLQHAARIDLHLSQEYETAITQLLNLDEDLEKYKADYLVPTLQKYRKDTVGDVTKEEVADFLVGSVIRVVVDMLGKKNCYVPDGDPKLFAGILINRQKELNNILSTKNPTAPSR